MISEAVQDHIRGLTELELAEYVARGEAWYEPDAVQFARQVYTARGFDHATIAALTAQIQERLTLNRALEVEMENEPLKRIGTLFSVLSLLDHVHALLLSALDGSA